MDLYLNKPSYCCSPIRSIAALARGLGPPTGMVTAPNWPDWRCFLRAWPMPRLYKLVKK